jgi:hypothetical protein
MNILDENILDKQRYYLKNWRIHVRQIGHEIGRQGIKDEEIIPLLHQLGEVTFFTRDYDFYQRNLCHTRYCLVCLAIEEHEVADFVYHFLRHPEFNTKAKRMGKVVRVSHNVIRMWKLHTDKEEEMIWHI